MLLLAPSGRTHPPPPERTCGSGHERTPLGCERTPHEGEPNRPHHPAVKGSTLGVASAPAAKAMLASGELLRSH